MPKIYMYDSVTGEYKGSARARVDPVTTEETDVLTWLLPANSTYEIPPEPREGFYPCFINGRWKFVKDNRGIIYNVETRDSYMFNNLGEDIPSGFTKFPPPDQNHLWDGEKWVMDELKKKEDDLEQLIQEEMETILRNIAIRSLRTKGKIK